jgi:hypothetical protein
MCHPLEHQSQTNIMATPMDKPHNIHHKPIGLTAKDFVHPHWENDMVDNYAHGPSMSNYFVLPTTILWKVRHAKSHDLQSHPMWWVMSATNKHNPMVRTYKPKVNNLFLELWHIEKYPSVERLSNSP